MDVTKTFKAFIYTFYNLLLFIVFIPLLGLGYMLVSDKIPNFCEESLGVTSTTDHMYKVTLLRYRCGTSPERPYGLRIDSNEYDSISKSRGWIIPDYPIDTIDGDVGTPTISWKNLRHLTVQLPTRSLRGNVEFVTEDLLGLQPKNKLHIERIYEPIQEVKSSSR